MTGPVPAALPGQVPEPHGGLHIVQVANFYGPRSGGLRTTLQALGRGYRAAGHRFTAVVAGESDSVRATDFGRLYTVRGPAVPGTGGYRVVTRRKAVTDLLALLAPDRLELSDRTTLHVLGRWARSMGVPSTFFAHERVDGVLGSVRVPGGPARRLADLRNRGTTIGFDTIVATTGYAAEEFARIGARNLVRIPLGVDLEQFVPGSRPATQRLELLLCSRLSVEKAPEAAIDTLIELRSRGVDAHLTVAGDGPRRSALERRSAGHPVTFLGFVPGRAALAQVLSGADVAIAPGPIETFGLAALECLASGTPVVVDRRSALPEVIGRDPAAGRAAEPTPAGFADAVQRVMAHPLAHRRSAARARAEQFPWSATVEKMLALHLAADLRVETGSR